MFCTFENMTNDLYIYPEKSTLFSTCMYKFTLTQMLARLQPVLLLYLQRNDFAILLQQN